MSKPDVQMSTQVQVRAIILWGLFLAQGLSKPSSLWGSTSVPVLVEIIYLTAAPRLSQHNELN